MHRQLTTVATFSLLFASSISLAADHDFYAYSTSFSPTSVDAMPGDTIHWHYATGYPHSVTFGIDCIWDGGLDEPLDGSTGEVVWTIPSDEPAGEINFFCDPHCTYDMAGVINVLEPVDPGHLVFGIIDLANVGIDMGVDQTTGEGGVAIDADGGNFAFGFDVEEGDIDVEFDIADGTVYLTDADGTTAISSSTMTMTDGSRFSIHGEGNAAFTMGWQDGVSDDGADLIGINCETCSININGDMASFRTAGPSTGTLTFRGEGEIPMSVIGDVTSSLTLPGFGEEGDVVIPAGIHTIELNGSTADDDLAWLLVHMGGGDDGGDSCPEDIDGDGSVNVGDLLSVIGAWGNTCP